MCAHLDEELRRRERQKQPRNPDGDDLDRDTGISQLVLSA